MLQTLFLELIDRLYGVLYNIHVSRHLYCNARPYRHPAAGTNRCTERRARSRLTAWHLVPCRVVKSNEDDPDFPIYPNQEMEMLAQLYAAARLLTLSGLRSRYPQATEAELHRKLANLLLGEALAHKVCKESAHAQRTTRSNA